MLPPLPQDILLQILDYCDSEDFHDPQRQTLHAWSRVSSALRHPAQKKLFRNRRMILTFEHRQFQFDSFLASNPRITSYVQNLTLGFSGFICPPRSLCYIEHLKSLSLYVGEARYGYDNWTVITMKASQLKNDMFTLVHLPSLEAFMLTDLKNFPITWLFERSTSIKELRINGAALLDPKPSPMPHRPKVKSKMAYLETLAIDSPHILRQILQFVDNVVPSLSLSRLQRFFGLATDDGDGVTLVQRVLDLSANTLHTLRLGTTYTVTPCLPLMQRTYRSERTDVLLDCRRILTSPLSSDRPWSNSLDLSRLHCLTHLTLAVGWPEDVADAIAWSCRAIQSLPEHNNLTEVKFIFHLVNTAQPLKQWNALDLLLTRERHIPTLRRVVLVHDFTRWGMRAYVGELLPNLSRMNMLRIPGDDGYYESSW